ncbi:MAG TPA: acyl-CoA dehydrogenase family protein [Acidimicrobiales bacterium]|nr:acyl-CoA dehydrogenase family protein [Acidimicrobiales bacterium]
MDVRLSPEQQALSDSAAQIVDRLGPRAVGQLDDRERADKLEAAVSASGWRDLRDSESDGRPLASAVEVAIVAEELGRGLAGAPFLGLTLAAELRRLGGAPPATSPETIALSLSLSEPAVAVDGAAPTGALALDARGATSALVLVPVHGGHGLAQVSLHALEVRTDLTRPAAAVDPASAVVPVPGGPLTVEDVWSWTAMGLALTSADLVGTMRGAIDLTVGYAAFRRQYGRPIGSFQAVQHLLADAFVLMEGSRSIARYAAWAVDALPADAALAAAAGAKAYCARAARTVCETSIQVHGGIGNTWECLAHVFLRRALVSSEVLGGEGVSLERVLAHHGIGDGNGLQ